MSLSGKQLVMLDFRTYLRVRKDSLLKTRGITCYMLAHRKCSVMAAVITEARLQGQVVLTGAFQAWEPCSKAIPN